MKAQQISKIGYVSSKAYSTLNETDSAMSQPGSPNYSVFQYIS